MAVEIRPSEAVRLMETALNHLERENKVLRKKLASCRREISRQNRRNSYMNMTASTYGQLNNLQRTANLIESAVYKIHAGIFGIEK